MFMFAFVLACIQREFARYTKLIYKFELRKVNKKVKTERVSS